jgi:quinol monooxygenase YgiN
MRLFIPLLLAMTLTPVLASSTPAQEAPVYVVSYIEVAPSAAAAAAGLLRQLAGKGRKDDGNTRFDVLQRTAPSNQFAVVAIWKDQEAYDAHLAAGHSKEFREKIKPDLISGIDDRLHSGIEIAAAPVGETAAGAIVVVTHVDVPPPKKDDCISLLKSLVEDSRKEPGSGRFEVFQQTSRPNHFSVVEIWTSQAAYDGHITAAHTKKFREQLTPMSGALYDERLYKVL